MNQFPRRQFMLSSALFVGCSKSVFAAAQATTPIDPRVRTEQGIVVGAQDKGAMAWKGIPFAEPPVDRLRGRVPQAPAVRSGSLDATAYRSEAVQQQGFGQPTGGIAGSEDCLYLNIWAPIEKQSGKLPVIVWIHGGGFVGGSGSEPVYAGDWYSSAGRVVFVTINYRLNGFGFLYNPHEPGSANIGLLDQMQALKWVKRNIENFGGDPDNLTIMGESAGAMSIGHLLGTPMAVGLFDKAVTQSGATSHCFSDGEHKEVAEKVFSIAGITPNDYDALFRLSSAELGSIFGKTTQQLRGSALAGMIPFHSTVDGIVLPKHPLHNIHPTVKTLIAHCKVEMATFYRPGSPSTGPNALHDKQSQLVGPKRWAAIEAAYDGTSETGASSDLELYSDSFCGLASLRLADALVDKHASAWSYRFDYDAAAPWGAGHATDIAFTFYRGPSTMTTGRGAPLPWSDERKSVGETVWGMLVNFARDGKPSHPSLPDWPQHDKRTIPFMSIDAKSTVKNDFIGATRRAAWAGVTPEQMI